MNVFTLNVVDKKEKEIRSLFLKQKIIDTFAFLLALAGWICEYLEYDRYYNQILQVTTVGTPPTLRMDLRNEQEESLLSFLRALETITTAPLLYCIYKRNMVEIQIRTLQENFIQSLARPIPKNQLPEVRIRRKILLYTVFEFFILAFHSLPHVNTNFPFMQQKGYLEYSLDILVVIIMQLRLYLVPRLLKHYSSWMSRDAVEVCKSQGASANFMFAFKSLLKQRPLMLVFSLVVFLMICGGFSMRAFERPYELVSLRDWSTYENSIWCTFAIITTVGYGDIVPATYTGRAIAVFVCFAGQFLTSLTVASISGIVSFTKPQERAYYQVTALNTKENFTIIVKKMVLSKFRYNIQSKFPHKYQNIAFHHRKYKEYQEKYRHLRMERYHNEINIPFSTLIDKVITDIREKKFDVVRFVRKAETIFHRIAAIEKNFDLTEKSITSLLRQNSNILLAFENVNNETEVNSPFDALFVNPKSLRHFDNLASPPASLDLIPVSNSSTNFVGELSKNNNSLFSQKARFQRILTRLNKTKVALDPEVKQLIEAKIPSITLRMRRALTEDKGAQERLMEFMQDRQRKKKSTYITKDELQSKILDDSSPTRVGRIKSVQFDFNGAVPDKRKTTIISKSSPEDTDIKIRPASKTLILDKQKGDNGSLIEYNRSRQHSMTGGASNRSGQGKDKVKNHDIQERDESFEDSDLDSEMDEVDLQSDTIEKKPSVFANSFSAKRGVMMSDKIRTATSTQAELDGLRQLTTNTKNHSSKSTNIEDKRISDTSTYSRSGVNGILEPESPIYPIKKNLTHFGVDADIDPEDDPIVQEFKRTLAALDIKNERESNRKAKGDNYNTIGRDSFSPSISFRQTNTEINRRPLPQKVSGSERDSGLDSLLNFTNYSNIVSPAIGPAADRSPNMSYEDIVRRFSRSPDYSPNSGYQKPFQPLFNLQPTNSNYMTRHTQNTDGDKYLSSLGTENEATSLATRINPIKLDVSRGGSARNSITSLLKKHYDDHK